MKNRCHVAVMCVLIIFILGLFGYHSLILASENTAVDFIKFDLNEEPWAIDVDSGGNIYVYNYPGCIKKYDPRGNLLANWRDLGSNIISDVDIDVDSKGNIYASYSLNGTFSIGKYDSNGKLIAKWKRKARGDFSYMAVDLKGNIYVSETEDQRIYKYNSSGKLITSWGSQGKGDGQFGGSPWGIAVDSLGNIYSADTGNHRIQKFDSNCKFITKWYLPWASAVDVDAKDNIYAYASSPGDDVFDIQKFTSTGTLISSWHIEFKNLQGIEIKAGGMAVDPSGNAIYLADVTNRRILKVDTNVSPASQADQQSTVIADSQGNAYLTDSKKPGEVLMSNPNGIAADSLGYIYVADLGNHEIKKFNPTGKLITAWGKHTLFINDFFSFAGIAVDSKGNVYAYNNEGYSAIQKYDSNGKFIEEGDPGIYQGRTGITVDSRGNVYVMSYEKRCVYKIDTKGEIVTKWGTEGFGDGQFEDPRGIATDSKGNVYVTDALNYCIQVFDSNGSFISKWYPPGGYDYWGAVKAYMERGGDLPQKPDILLSGIVLDSVGNVYATDETKCCIYKFDHKGACIATWGSKGSGDGQFSRPVGITVDPQGNVYVVDYDNACVRKFDSEGKFITRWGAKGELLN